MSHAVSNQHARDLAYRLSRLQPLLDASTTRVSTGSRIDRPSRDVAGVGLVAKLEGEQSRLGAVSMNLQNGMSRLQVSTDQIRVLNNVVTRLAELTTLRANPVQGSTDQALYTVEAAVLQEQLRQTVGGTAAEVGGTTDVDRPLGRFNGRDLFGPESGEVLAIGLQIDEIARLPVINLRQGAVAQLLSQDASGNFDFDLSQPGAIALIDGALDQLGLAQAHVGAVQSRLELAADVITTSRTNGESALSSIRDADIATETTLRTRLQILMEGHTAMILQARDINAKLLPLLARR